MKLASKIYPDKAKKTEKYLNTICQGKITGKYNSQKEYFEKQHLKQVTFTATFLH